MESSPQMSAPMKMSPEAELVSLLEEQLPQYKLRWLFHENQDWTQSPHQQQHASDTLSPVLREETFRMSEYLNLSIELKIMSVLLIFTIFDIPKCCLVCTYFNSNCFNNMKRWL